MKKKAKSSRPSVLYYLSGLRWHIVFVLVVAISLYPTLVLIFIGIPSVFFLFPLLLYVCFAIYRMITQPRKRHVFILLVSILIFCFYFRQTTYFEIKRICTTKALEATDMITDKKSQEWTNQQYATLYRNCLAPYTSFSKRIRVHFEYFSFWQTKMKNNIKTTE